MTSVGDVLYQKGQSDSDSEYDDNQGDGNEWDDQLLIKAYDKALKHAKAEVARRIAGETNNLQSNHQSSQLDPPTAVSNGRKPKKGKSKKRGSGANNFSVGDSCRAVYSEDGVEYEAEIMEMIEDDHVLIKYVGYDNEETLPLSSLKESLGAHAIIQQIKAVFNNTSNKEDINQKGVSSKNKSSKSKRNKLNMDTFGIPGLGNIPAPFCPIPPGLDGLGGSGFMGLGGFNGLEAHDSDSMDGPLSSMLVSWYLSGYHTGYYRGLQQGSKTSRKSRKE